MPVVVDGARSVLVLVRGDHRLNEIKLRNALGADFRPAQAEEIEAELGAGPASSARSASRGRVVLDGRCDRRAVYVAGANQPGAHLRGVDAGRDFEFEVADIRTVEGDDVPAGGGTIEIEPAIEVGNIFKLGTATRSRSAPPTSTRSGEERPIVMGSYGIGPARIVAAAIEQGADEHGHRLAARRSRRGTCTSSLAAGRRRRARRARLYEELPAAGLDVLYDDRDARPGEKFTDAELLGCPCAIVGRKSLDEGAVEVRRRTDQSDTRAVYWSSVIDWTGHD